MAREGVPLVVIQRQLGHSNLGITSVYLQGIDNAEIIDTVPRSPRAHDPRQHVTKALITSRRCSVAQSTNTVSTMRHDRLLKWSLRAPVALYSAHRAKPRSTDPVVRSVLTCLIERLRWLSVLVSVPGGR
jgi:hypothetical protein